MFVSIILDSCLAKKKSMSSSTMAQPSTPHKLGGKSVPLLFTCDICGQEGMNELDMRSHVLIEHVEHQISCPFCDLEGTTLEDMNCHINAQHLDFLTPTKESSVNDGSEKGPFDAGLSDMSNYSSLQSNTSTSTSTATTTTRGAAGPLSPTEITISRIQDLPSGEDIPVTGEGLEGEQSAKRAKLFLDVPPISTANLNPKESATSTSDNCLKKCHQVNAHVNHSSLSSSSSALKGNDNYGMENSSNSSGKDNLQEEAPWYSCPMCSWTTVSPNEITHHVNVVHLDAISPSHHNHWPGLDNNTVSTSTTPPLEKKNSTAADFECPLCGTTCDTISLLEEHVNCHHGDDLSLRNSLVHSQGGSTNSLQCCCPLCGMECSDSTSLQLHVDGHFSAEHTPGNHPRFCHIYIYINIVFCF